MTTPDSPRPPFRSRREIHQRRRAEEARAQETTASGLTPAPPSADAQATPAAAERPAGAQATPRRGAPLVGGLRDPASPETTGMRSRRLAQERRNIIRRRRARRIRSFFILTLVLALLGGAAWFAYSQIADQQQSTAAADDYTGEGTGSVEITIEEGASGTAIGQSLVEGGVVKSMDAFTRAFNSNKAATSIRPGTYTLKLQMSASAAIAALLDDANRSDNTVTVTPGQTVAEVRGKIVSVTGLSAAEVDKAFSDPGAIGLPEAAGGNAEGWLLPGSYEVSSSDTPTTLVAKMVKGTVDELNKLKVPTDQQQTVLIKASILEREMHIAKYRPMVARVIENRLATTENETRGLLQMDASVLYGVGKTGGVPTAEDLTNDNPYNTYLHPGLPPTPIAQPSQDSIKAVMAPADGAWLYYVTIDLDTGETLFATTLAEQTRNKERFDAYCAANPGKC